MPHLSSYSVSNFRKLKHPAHIGFAPLTLLYGPEGSGKSSLLYSLMILYSSLSKVNMFDEPLLFFSRYYDCKSFNISKNQKDRPISFKLRIDNSLFNQYENTSYGPSCVNVSSKIKDEYYLKSHFSFEEIIIAFEYDNNELIKLSLDITSHKNTIQLLKFIRNLNGANIYIDSEYILKFIANEIYSITYNGHYIDRDNFEYDILNPVIVSIVSDDIINSITYSYFNFENCFCFGKNHSLKSSICELLKLVNNDLSGRKSYKFEHLSVLSCLTEFITNFFEGLFGHIFKLFELHYIYTDYFDIKDIYSCNINKSKTDSFEFYLNLLLDEPEPLRQRFLNDLLKKYQIVQSISFEKSEGQIVTKLYKNGKLITFKDLDSQIYYIIRLVVKILGTGKITEGIRGTNVADCGEKPVYYLNTIFTTDYKLIIIDDPIELNNDNLSLLTDILITLAKLLHTQILISTDKTAIVCKLNDALKKKVVKHSDFKINYFIEFQSESHVNYLVDSSSWENSADIDTEAELNSLIHKRLDFIN